MAVSGNEPISAGNLAALAGQLGKEVIFAGWLADLENDPIFNVDLSDFEGFDVTIVASNFTSHETKRVPAVHNQAVTIANVSVRPYQPEAGWVQFAFDTNGYNNRCLSRIVGIRSGGGSL